MKNLIKNRLEKLLAETSSSTLSMKYNNALKSINFIHEDDLDTIVFIFKDLLVELE